MYFMYTAVLCSVRSAQLALKSELCKHRRCKYMSMEKEKQAAEQKPQTAPQTKPEERGGPKGPEPTRYSDWEINGKCVDF